MFIKSLNFNDARHNITLADIHFSQANLLVGPSGCGKTTLIEALFSLGRISQGDSSVGDSWSMIFVDDLKREVHWQGCFLNTVDKEENTRQLAELVEEKLLIDGRVIFEKSAGETQLLGEKVAGLDPYRSNIFLLLSESDIAVVDNALLSIGVVHVGDVIMTDATAIVPINQVNHQAVARYCQQNDDVIINALHRQFVEMDCREKLFYASHYDPQSFGALNALYAMMFEDVKWIKPVVVEIPKGPNAPYPVKAVSINLVLKDGIEVPQSSISLGMFKSLMLLSDLMFSSPYAVFVIDGIDYGLGDNCLAGVVHALKQCPNQYIVSTHNFAVIGRIDEKDHKTVSREGGVIRLTPVCG